MSALRPWPLLPSPAKKGSFASSDACCSATTSATRGRHTIAPSEWFTSWSLIHVTTLDNR